LDEFASIREICRLPAHMDELFSDRNEVARRRMYGQTGYSILLLESEFFGHDFFGQLEGHPGFVCVISNAATHASVSAHFAQRKNNRWLHVTTLGKPTGERKLWDLDRKRVYDWTKNVLRGIASMDRGRKPAEADFRPLAVWEKLSAPVPSRVHNVLTPTETVYLSLGYRFDLPEDKLAGNEDETFAKALATTAEALQTSLTELTGDKKRPPGFPTMILTVPSVSRHLASRRRTPKGTPAAVRRAMRAVMRQKQYIAFRATAEETKEFLGSGPSRAIIQMRSKELHLYTAAVTVATCSLCCPALRLPPQLDRARDLLVGLATLSRKGNEAQRRRNQLALRIGETYRALIPEALIETIDGLAHKGVKLIGDVPLELLPVDGLPLSLRSSVSRLPTLPGNLLVRHSLTRAPFYLTPSDFHDVLIVRSFQPDDPLRDLVRVSIEVVLKKGSKVKVKIVDVSNEAEFIEAFNAFDGKLAIFDGHGTQRAEDAEGTLHVGPLKINPFAFYGKIKVPPIIILSACETHTLEGFESSVAGAFLFMGAHSVLGTLAPIEARSAATLIARFLFRLEAFLPALGGPMNWTEVVTGMLRMSYVTDMVRKFEQIHGMPSFHLNPVQMVANMTINGNDPTWFNQVLKALAKETKETEQQVKERWLDTCYFAETLRYVHLGSPEHIYVVPD
jgi:CHAT domain